jgi:hypothetical protein
VNGISKYLEGLPSNNNCGVEVEVEAGWLVNSEQIPKWKHAKKAFSKARAKKYYVQCSEADA